jgi:hypothetical protein
MADVIFDPLAFDSGAFASEAVLPDTATISSVAPTSGLVGASVFITGVNFSTAGVVRFSGITATILVWTATSITCTVPTTPAGTKSVTVTPTGGSVSNGVVFTVTTTPAPLASITSLTPDSGDYGTSVIIDGQNFGASGTVRFGGTAATTSAWSTTSITATVPNLPASAQNVTVTPSGGAASAASTFTVTGAPPPPPPPPPLPAGPLAVTIGGLDVTDVLLPGFSWSTTNPGGFGDATMQLPATNPWAPYDEAVVKGAAVTITHDGTTLYEGEVTNDVSHAIVEGGTIYYDVTCAGLWWKAGQRGDFCQVWTDDDYGQWFSKPTAAKVYSLDTEGKLEVRIEKGQSAKGGSAASLYYWLSDGMGNPADSITFLIATVEVDTAVSATWHAKIQSSDSPWGTWTLEQEWHDEVVSAGTPLFIPVTAQALRLSFFSDGDVSGATDDRFITLRRIAVCGNDVPVLAITDISKDSPALVTTAIAHSLKVGDRVFIAESNSVAVIDGWHIVASTPETTTFTMTGVNVLTTAGTGGFVVRALRVDEAMADVAVTAGLATSSSLQTDGIGNVNWGLNVRPHTSRAEAIDYLSMTHSAPIDYGFWDGAVFHCKERIASEGDSDILIDSSTPGIDFNVFQTAEDAPTVVKVLYKFRDVEGGSSTYPDGTVLAVYRPSAPTWADGSVVLDVWDEWADLSLETQQAEAIGDQILKWLDANAYQGYITIAAPTVPLRVGGTKNTIYIRAGDYIEDTNLGTGTLMITSTSVAADSGTATLAIGENRRDFVARIMPRARRAPGVMPNGRPPRKPRR